MSRPVILSLFLVAIQFARADLWTLPNITITEFNDETGETQAQHQAGSTEEEATKDIIVGEDTQAGNSLLFSCIAPYPVQWIYTGDGRPELSTNTSIKFVTGKRSGTPFDFTAFAYITNPREKNTGNYTCRSLQDPRVSSSYFIYVPGPTLFTSSGGYELPFSRNEPSIRIPCSVSNPRALVGLQKAVDGLLNCPLNESISYNPKTGFHLKTSDFPDPGGHYVCTAAHNGTLRYIEFNLTGNSLEVSDPPMFETCFENSECEPDKACIAHACTDPCEDICGINAKCRTVNHIPECYCPGALVGDPYFICRPKPGEDEANEAEGPPSPTNHTTQHSDPCTPSPCGEHGECKFSGKVLVCVCKSGFYGTPPDCKPKTCNNKEECSADQACIQGTCSDPCITGVCGKNAKCRVVNRSPVCSCAPGFIGDPFDECRPVVPDQPMNLQTSTSKTNDDEGDTASCKGLSCGRNAQCKVLGDGRQICQCEVGYNRGDPYTACYKESELERNPCLSSPCGPNTICRVAINGSAYCTCMPDTSGNPYIGCRALNCALDSDCRGNQICSNRRCQEGCQASQMVCGHNAECKTKDHTPKCACLVGFTGIPETNCYPIPTRPSFPTTKLPIMKIESGPCNPSPCGHNAECTMLRGRALCRCPSPLQGDPVISCDHRCRRTSDCPKHQVCYNRNNTCVDPCLIYDTGCGVNAVCKVSNHQPSCYCPPGYSGSPYSRCYRKQQQQPADIKESQSVPCYPLPCGANAVCVADRQLGTSTCACKTGFYGDPFAGCQKGELCRADADCSGTTGCLHGRCIDPCRFQGVCGINQECRIINHKATCYCRKGYPVEANGNCYREPIAEGSVKPPKVPASPPQQSQHHHQQHYPQAPRPPANLQQQQQRPPHQQQQQQQTCAACGPYSECRVARGVVACSCKPGMIGSPPHCRPECQYDGQCSFERACINFRCQDPCVNACGTNALCRVRQRTPVCSCPRGYYGNPVYGCKCCDHERTNLQDDDEYDEQVFGSTPADLIIPSLGFNETLDFII